MHVLDVATGEDGSVLLEVESDDVLTGCPDCGVVAIGHGRRVQLLHDAPCFGRPVRVRWRKRIWRCPEPACARRTWTEVQPYATPRAKLTARATSWAVEALRHDDTTVSAIARHLGVAWDNPYSAGLRNRVLPALGHLPVSMMSAGLIDRRSTSGRRRTVVRRLNTIAALVLVLDEAVRDGLLMRNPAKDRARRRSVGRSALPIAAQESPRDFALPDVGTLSRLVEQAVQRGGHQAWGDCVMILATTALRISEVAGLQVGDVDLFRGLLAVRRQTYPGRGGLVTKETKGRRRRPVPIIEPLRATLERLTVGRARDARLLVGPRGGVITTATLRDATGWDELVDDLGLAGLVRHGLRHTALTWMADAGVELHLLQRVAGHQDPAVTSRYLHPDHQAVLDVGAAYSRWWAQSGPNSPALRLVEDGPVAG